MMLWVTLAVIVTAGALARSQYSLDAEPVPAAPEPRNTGPSPRYRQADARRQPGAVARGAAQGRAARGRAAPAAVATRSSCYYMGWSACSRC